jgi:hypothetical protein
LDVPSAWETDAGGAAAFGGGSAAVRLACGLGGVRRFRGGRAGFVDRRYHRVHLHGGAFLHLDFLEHARRRRGNLGVDLVGGDLEERLVALDLVARLLQPLGDSAFKDRLAHLRHDYVGRHRFPFRCLSASRTIGSLYFRAGLRTQTQLRMAPTS